MPKGVRILASWISGDTGPSPRLLAVVAHGPNATETWRQLRTGVCGGDGGESNPPSKRRSEGYATSLSGASFSPRLAPPAGMNEAKPAYVLGPKRVGSTPGGTPI